MDDCESGLEKSPYMKNFYNYPPPAARPITTSLAANPYHDQRPRHLRPTGRLGAYSLQPETSSNMVGFENQRSSSLIPAALGPSHLAKSRPRASPLSTVHLTHSPGYHDSETPRSSKRKHAAEETSSDLSEHDDDEFSPATTRRFAPTPMKKHKRQLGGKKRKNRRHLSDEEMNDEEYGEVDEDAEEEEALMRVITRRQGRSNSSSINKTPAGSRRKQDSPATPMDGILYHVIPPGVTESSLKKKPKGKPVPRDLKSADRADRMMFRWKNGGRPWDEIRDEYERITGTRPAASSLSVRFIKLNENLAANGFRDEVALLKAYAEAEIKTSQPFWKEVSAQMKKITDQDFATPSLRKRYEEIKRRQFFLGEESPTKYNQWPALQINSKRKGSLFHSMPELTPTGLYKGVDDQLHHQSGGRRYVLDNISSESLSTEKILRDDDMESVTTNTGQEGSSIFITSNSKDREVLGMSGNAFEDENESPSHSHPRANYGNGRHATEVAIPRNMGSSTPTPATAAGVAVVGTGAGHGLGSDPRPGLVRYGDSDDSD